MREGGKATILFIAALPGARAFQPNRAADVELYYLLMAAHRAGVEMRAIGMAYDRVSSYVFLYHPDLPVHLV